MGGGANETVSRLVQLSCQVHAGRKPWDAEQVGKIVELEYGSRCLGSM